jgi:hypothetical protein
MHHQPQSGREPAMPPALIGLLLLLAATLAVIFIIAAQNVHTP